SITAVTSGSNRNRGVLMLAAVFGILSAMLMFAFLSNRGGSSGSVDKALTDGGGYTSAVVVSQDVPFGTVITAGMVNVQSVPNSVLVNGHATKTEDVVGKIATAPLFKGQQVLSQQFTTFAGQNAAAYKVPDGMRAVALTVPSEGWIVGGLPQPGDHVDFLAITTLSRTDPLTGQEKPDVRADIIGQDIEILAVSQTLIKTIPKVAATAAPAASGTATAGSTETPAASGNSASKPLDDGTTFEKALSITLAVKPDMAAKISLIDAMKKEVGQWRLLLRQQGDSSPVVGGTSFSYDDVFPTK
ncbi:MAG: Flp pilus assembly protein CpaB, partial [Tepidiformaceae bacterium]